MYLRKLQIFLTRSLLQLVTECVYSESELAFHFGFKLNPKWKVNSDSMGRLVCAWIPLPLLMFDPSLLDFTISWNESIDHLRGKTPEIDESMHQQPSSRILEYS